jgi:YD repeat-containing protein
MRVKEILATDPAANPMMHYRYSYDKMDNITEKATGHGEYAYGYDPLYRLTAADNPTLPKEAYSYDGAGNRLTSIEHSDWSYNQNNELYGYNGITFGYDASGNTTQKNDNGAVTNYLYNIEDRLSRVTDGAGSLTASYYYDPFGRRLWKEVAGVRTYFVYADEGLVAEADAAGTVTKTYGYRPGSTWTTDPLFIRQGGQYYFYQNDHLGTPQKMTSVSGAKVWEATYKAFGEVEIWTHSSVVNNLRFPGQYYDSDTELNYNFSSVRLRIAQHYLSN